MPIYLLPLLLAFTSCSLQKMALRSSTPILEKTSDSMMKEGNWDYFKLSAPGNLKFLELLYDQDPENMKLLSVLIKSYAGYAFGVKETLYFEEEMKNEDSSPEKFQAIDIYTRAFDYGMSYLKKKGIKSGDFLANDEEALKKKLQKLDEEDAIAVLYTAQSWGSLINLQKDNIALVSQIPKVKMLFDRVCEIKPDIDHNVCDIFYAQYEVSRPKMLGGNPEKGEKMFLEAIEKHPKNLLIRVTYLQQYIVPQGDLEKYETHAKLLHEEFLKFSDKNRDSLVDESPYKDVPGLNLYNAIAKKRFLIIDQNKKRIF